MPQEIMAWVSRILAIGAAIFFLAAVLWFPGFLKKQNIRNAGGVVAVRTPGSMSLKKGLTIFMGVWSIFAMFLCGLFFIMNQNDKGMVHIPMIYLLVITMVIYFLCLCFTAYLLLKEPIGGSSPTEEQFYQCLRLALVGFASFFTTIALMIW